MTFIPDHPGPQEKTSTRSTELTRELAASKRTLGEDAVPVPSHSNANVPADYRSIPGWGVDLDPKNRPAVPRELPTDVRTIRGEVKHWQEPRHKIHVSNEQPGITPVFGESCPPRGLSGLLRDYAYQYGEATSRHWMTLLLADRVDRIESMALDAMRGRPDHFLEERGSRAALDYGDGTLHKKRDVVLIGAAVAIGAVALAFALRNAMAEE
jgi:hypothetical protein